VDLAQMGLDGPPVILLSQAQLRTGTGGASPRVHLSRMEIGGGPTPPGPGGRVQVAAVMLYGGSTGPTPGVSLLAQWDGTRWVRLPVATWDGSAWVGAS